MQLTDIEARIFALSDRVREQDADAARQIIALVVALREWHQTERHDRERKINDLMRKWTEFSNGSVQEAYDRNAAELEHERARVARILATDPRWQGSYADLIGLIRPE